MAFIVPRHALTSGSRLDIRLTPDTRVVPARELTALREGEAIVAEAARQAQELLSRAQDAFEAEKRRGFDAGRAEAQIEQAEMMMEHVARTVDYFSRIEERMVELVMQAVQKIIEDFDDKERIVITVKNALSAVRNQSQLTLRLNPQQVDVVKERLSDLLSAYPGVGHIDIRPDARIKSGACIIESDIGLVEASIEGQLTALRDAFSKVLGSRV